MNTWVRSQFGHPRGTLGHLVGWVMALENRERNEWVVRQLPLKKDSRVLEVGFGPGMALRSVAQRVSEGMIVGIDPSSIMVSQASRRNLRSIMAGRMRLIYGTAEGNLEEEDPFDVVFSVNTLGRHYDLSKSLEVLSNKIVPGGVLAIAHQSPSKASEDEVVEFRRSINKAMAEAGFTDFQILQKEAKTSPICLILGRLPSQAASEGDELKRQTERVLD